MGMTPDRYVDRLEDRLMEAAMAATTETALVAQDLVKSNLPSQRVQTRRAVRHRVKKTRRGPRATIGLQFAKKYRSQNTDTERLFRQAWRRSELKVKEAFRKAFGNKLRSI